MRKITDIIIHCSATPEGRDVSVETLRKWHKAKGWKDVGYHYIIDIRGERHEGRPIEKVGAHTEGHNAHSVGVCYVGGCDTAMKPKDTRTERQKAELLKLIRELLVRYPGARVTGHNEWAAKACPSFDVQRWKKEVGL